jgi:hypothetical protein
MRTIADVDVDNQAIDLRAEFRQFRIRHLFKAAHTSHFSLRCDKPAAATSIASNAKTLQLDLHATPQPAV